MGALHRQDAEKLLAAGPIIGLLDAPRGRDAASLPRRSDRGFTGGTPQGGNMTDIGQPVTSFRPLLRHLARLTRNTVRLGRDYPTTLFSAPAAAARLRSPRDQAADFSVPPLRAVKSINCLPKNSAKFGLAGLHNGHATKPRRNRRRRMLCPFFLKCSIRF